MTDDVNERYHQAMVVHSHQFLGMVVKELRERGDDLNDHVVAIIETVDPNGQTFADNLSPKRAHDPANPHFIQAPKTGDLAKKLRRMSPDFVPMAERLESKPRPPKTIRVLTFARGEMCMFDVPTPEFAGASA